MRLEKPAIWLLILVTAYSLAHLFWYWQTPLGQMPALDGQENLLLAKAISSGELEREPFYRAILYPAILAVSPIHWMLLGLGCHIANTIMSLKLSSKLWNNRISELTTGALIGFNPVLLHFAFDPLDITLAISLFLLSLNLAIPNSQDKTGQTLSAKRLFASGFALALAALVRPHFFAVLMPACLAAAGLVGFRATYRKPALAFLLSALIPLLAFGILQKARNGSFQILPTQGAYNLWASNRPGANGLYFTQSLNFHYVGEHKNPTRLESEALYKREHGEVGTLEQRAAHWRGKAVEHMLGNPIDWARLMLFKTYAWFNNYEQYNNKTYSFHKSLSPWLRYNPIGWGLISLLAAASCSVLAKSNRKILFGALSIFALYSGAALLYMASARFRLPMVPLVAIMAGGAPVVLSQWQCITARQRGVLGFAILAFAFLGFSRFGSVASNDTIQQDTMLLADTASRTGRDLESFRWANHTLSLNDSRQDARRLRLLSFYNLVSTGRHEQTGNSWSDFENDLDRIELSDTYIEFAKGVCRWNLGQRERAIQHWTQNFESSNWDAASSLAALIYTESPLPNAFPTYPKDKSDADPLLVYTLNQSSASELKTKIGFQISAPEEFYRSVERSLKRALPLD